MTLEARVLFEGGGGAFTSGEIRAEYEHQYDPNTQSNTRIFGIGVYFSKKVPAPRRPERRISSTQDTP